MATMVKQIERDFLIGVLLNEQIPVHYLYDRTEYRFRVSRIQGNKLYFATAKTVENIKPKTKMNISFIYKNMQFSCSLLVIEVQKDYIITILPEVLYKNLDRVYARIPVPEGLEVQCFYTAKQYVLPFPKLSKAASSSVPQQKPFSSFHEGVKILNLWIKNYFDNVDICSFRNDNILLTEQRILATSGKILYIASTQEGLPLTDLSGELVTQETFAHYLETAGHNPAYLNKVMEEFIVSKRDKGILSEIWVPMIFQQYVVGTIHAWKTTESTAPFEGTDKAKLIQFSKDLVSMMYAEKYFEAGFLAGKMIIGKVVDISVSGFRIAYPISPFSSTLTINGEVTVTLRSQKRTITTMAKIVRVYQTSKVSFLGCHFVNMQLEDRRFFFECIYGQMFTDTNDPIVTGTV
ncbi:MAG: DUF1577 domain-containing protein [Treponema sp.]|jgi:hypothetical protein|nr:DUF1577 domain-containing protein [Treponema sp.]